MFRNSKTFTLVNIADGATFILNVKPLTLAMKANLDEWLRISYMSKAFDTEDFDAKKSASIADTLDCLSNNWTVPWSKLGIRMLYEMSHPDMPYFDFISKFFDLELGQARQGDNESVKRYKMNVEVVEQAFQYGCQNPTDTPAAAEQTKD